MSVILILILSLLFLSGAAYVHCIMSLLLFCVGAGSILVNISVWKGYFVILIYVGGMLIMMVYFASLSSWFLLLKQIMWMFLGSSLFLFEMSKGGLFSSSSMFYLSSSVELVWSLLILALICVLASQLLLGGKALRSITK